MASRPFQRVLGDTSLEWKCRLLFGICLMLLITGSFWWYGSQTDQLVYEQNRRNAQGLVAAIIAVHHWEELTTEEEFRRLVVVPLADDMQNQQYDWRTIKPKSPDGARQPQDEMEWALLERWMQVGGELKAGDEQWDDALYAQRHLPEQNEYQYYQPIFAKSICLDCHRNFDKNEDLREGDLLSIIQVRMSDRETVQAQNQNRAFLLTIAIVTVFLAMVALYAIVRYVIVKPLKHLREVSDEISRGNTELRADIHTGDEFEELGDAFNRMLRHLAAIRDELHGANDQLDKKVDQLAQANMRLYEMNRLKSDFLATVSHELRTPLNSIIGFSDILESGNSMPDKQKRYVHNIQRSGRMLLEMINDILDLAKIESGKMDVRLSEFPIAQTIAAQCDMARPLSEKKNIDLEFDAPKDLPPLYQDQGKAQQILSNLLSNAIKFTPEGGRITVTARRRPQGDLEMIVEDTGVGIAENDQKAIFEKFRQGSAALAGGDAMTREHSGTGLGLSIVKELCRLLEGEVALESELGKGSRFYIRLPWRLQEKLKPDSTLNDELDRMTRQPGLGESDPLETPVASGHSV